MNRHYSPASVGGGDSSALAKEISRTFRDSYYSGKQEMNARTETLVLAPAGQAFDLRWSGSEVDETFWRNESRIVMDRNASGMTRKQRAEVDGLPDESPMTPKPVFSGLHEQTRARSKVGR